MLKRNPKTRFFLVYILIGVVQLTAYLIVPPILALLFRWLGKLNPFWIWLDDTRKKANGSLADDYAIHLDLYGRWFRWFGVLSWHINRNKAWNFVELFSRERWLTPGNQSIKIISYKGPGLYKLTVGQEVVAVKSDGNWAQGAGLKFVGKPGQAPWQVNRGSVISAWHSIFGKESFTFEEPWRNNGTLYWRYTSCLWIPRKSIFGITVPFTNKWRTVYLGQNATRYSVHWKHQSEAPMRFDDWA